MRRFATSAFIASALLLVTAGVASASSHGAMPAGLSFLQVMQWELEHFGLHLQMIYQAIQTMFVSPSLGWDMLSDQSLCADQGNLTSHLFDTALHALMTFLDSTLVAVWVLVEVAARVWRSLVVFMRSPLYRVAKL